MKCSICKKEKEKGSYIHDDVFVCNVCKRQGFRNINRKLSKILFDKVKNV
jgi:hypothetical protein